MAFWSKKIEEFEEMDHLIQENPGISVPFQQTPDTNFQQVFLSNVAAGTPPRATAGRAPPMDAAVLPRRRRGAGCRSPSVRVLPAA